MGLSLPWNRNSTIYGREGKIVADSGEIVRLSGRRPGLALGGRVPAELRRFRGLTLSAGELQIDIHSGARLKQKSAWTF